MRRRKWLKDGIRDPITNDPADPRFTGEPDVDIDSDDSEPDYLVKSPTDDPNEWFGLESAIDGDTPEHMKPTPSE